MNVDVKLPRTHVPPEPARWVCLAVVTLAGALAYANSLDGVFVYDDRDAIVDNPFLRELRPIGQALQGPPNTTLSGRPAVTVTLWLNYQVSGLSPWSYHVFNIALHVFNAWLAFLLIDWILRRAGRPPGFARLIAACAALLWVVHPLTSSAVTYVVQRTEALAAGAYLATLYCALRVSASSTPKRWYVAAITANILGMASKEICVTAPLVVLLFDRALSGDGWREVFRKRAALYGGLAAGWLVLAVLVMSGTRTVNVQKASLAAGPWTYLLTEAQVLVHYLRLCAWPDPLVLSYDWKPVGGPGEVVPQGLALLALLGGTFYALGRALFAAPPVVGEDGARMPARTLVGLAGVWFFFILAPTSSFLPLTDPAFEHRMYLPMVSLAALAVGGLLAGCGRLPRGTTLATGLVLAAALALGVRTAYRNLDYRSRAAIWERNVAARPQNPYARTNYAYALIEAGRYDQAITVFHEALPLLREDLHYRVYAGLGDAYREKGAYEEALPYLRRSVEQQPDFWFAIRILGHVLAKLGRFDEAQNRLERVAKAFPGEPTVLNNLGYVLLARGQVDEAIETLHRAAATAPSSAENLYYLGWALSKKGRYAEAAAKFEQCLDLQPGYEDAEERLHAARQLAEGAALAPAAADALRQGAEAMQARQWARARKFFLQALQQDPDRLEAHHNLGWVYTREKQFVRALYHFHRALRIDPGAQASADGLAQLTDLVLAEVERTEYRDPEAMYALAVASAVNNAFDKAKNFAGEALRLAEGDGHADLRARIDARAKLFEQRRVFDGADGEEALRP